MFDWKTVLDPERFKELYRNGAGKGVYECGACGTQLFAKKYGKDDGIEVSCRTCNANLGYLPHSSVK